MKSIAAVIVCLASLVIACGSPMAPTPDLLRAQLTIRALEQTSHRPIADVTVSQAGRPTGLTDAWGVFVLPVIVGRETTIGVAKAGYTAVVPWVTAAPTGAETWTFYLEGGH